MATIGQIRYYEPSESAETSRNYNIDDVSKLTSGVFGGSGVIKKLGIQTLPGVAFYINNWDAPIIIGSTGIYELDVSDIAQITIQDIKFSGKSIDMINNNANAYLIIDYIIETDDDTEGG